MGGNQRRSRAREEAQEYKVLVIDMILTCLFTLGTLRFVCHRGCSASPCGPSSAPKNEVKPEGISKEKSQNVAEELVDSLAKPGLFFQRSQMTLKKKTLIWNSVRQKWNDTETTCLIMTPQKFPCCTNDLVSKKAHGVEVSVMRGPKLPGGITGKGRAV